jgi:hypothetical protein
MRWVGERPRTLLTRNGRVTVTRPYYHCRHCGRGLAPADHPCAIPSGQTTWAVRDRVALLGAWLPFGQAAKVYAHLTGQTVSPGSVEHLTEALGDAYVPPTPDRYTPGPPVDTLFLEVDAVLLRFEDGWHEVKVAVGWGRKAGEDLPPRYVTFQGDWDAFLPAIAALARQQGLRRARQVVCLADGAKPIWKLLQRLFPDALHVLDWYHLQGYLAAVARLLPDGAAWHAAQKTALAERGPGETRAALAALMKRGPGSRKAVREAAQKAFTYMAGRAEELDYPQARRRGYPIGSGRVESACKHVVQQRCKQPGMYWNHAHADAVLAARRAYLNGDWELANAQLRAKVA